MITVPVSAGTYQAVVASMQPGGGITLQSATEALGGSAGNAFQLIGTPLQLANGQIIGKKQQSLQTFGFTLPRNELSCQLFGGNK